MKINQIMVFVTLQAMMIIHAAITLVRLLNIFHHEFSDSDTLNWNSAVFKHLSHHQI